MAIYGDIIRHVLGKRYRIERRLGAGAFGEVFLAAHDVYGLTFRHVAIKLFANKYVTSANAAKVFNEALQLERAAAKARSRGEIVHLVMVHDIGVFEDYYDMPFMAMEVIEGGSLADRIPAGLGLKPAVRLVRQICAGLKVAHEQGVYHRDLKPANILFSSTGADSFLKIADFGLAIDREAAFREGGAAGTISYTPPDPGTGFVVDGRFDVYSMGVILLEFMLKENPLGTVLKQAQDEGVEHRGPLAEGQRRLADLLHPTTRQPLVELHAELRADDDMQEVLRTCLAFESRDRYSDAMALDAALDRWEQKLPQPKRITVARPPASFDDALAAVDTQLRKGDYAAAHEHLRRAQALCRSRDHESRHAVAAARLYEAEGEMVQAIHAVERAIQLAGKTQKLLYRLAELFQLDHRFDAAKATREEARLLK